MVGIGPNGGMGLNASQYVVENGGKWRRLPGPFDNWHTIYTWVNRRAKNGVLARVFAALPSRRLVEIKVETASLESASIKVHPDGTGALEKSGPQAIGKCRDGWNTEIPMVAAGERTAISSSLSPGQAAAGPEGRKLLDGTDWSFCPEVEAVIMDRAYEETRTGSPFST